MMPVSKLSSNRSPTGARKYLSSSDRTQQMTADIKLRTATVDFGRPLHWEEKCVPSFVNCQIRSW